MVFPIFAFEGYTHQLENRNQSSKNYSMKKPLTIYGQEYAADEADQALTVMENALNKDAMESEEQQVIEQAVNKMNDAKATIDTYNRFKDL